MPLRNVATTFTIEQQRLEINALAGDVNNIETGVTAVANATTATTATTAITANTATTATTATTALTANALAATATGADLTLSGTLTVNGSQTILNTATLEVEDKNIVIAKGSTTDAAASGGGITLKGADDKTLLYNQTGDKWEFNKPLNVGGSAATAGSWGQTDWNLEVFDSAADCYTLLAGAAGAALELKDTVTGEAFVLAANGDCNLYSYLNGDSMSFHTTNGSGTGKRLEIDSDGDATFAGNISCVAGTFYNASGQAQLNIGSGSAGGALLALDGDSDGDVSGGDYAYIKHDTSGDLIIAADNPNNDGEIKLQTSDGATLALTLAGYNATFGGDINLAEGKKTIFGSNSGNGAYIKHQSSHLEIKNETGNCYWDNTGSIRIRTQTSGNYTDKLEITSDKIMASVDFKPNAHHSLDIGTASNAFRDIYSQTLTASSVYDGRGNLRRISGVNPTGVYDVVSGDGGTQGRYILTSNNVRLAGGMTAGDMITIINNGGSDITIDAATNSVTLTNSADASTGDRTLASKGMATVLYVGSATAFISGGGLS